MPMIAPRSRPLEADSRSSETRPARCSRSQGTDPNWIEWVCSWTRTHRRNASGSTPSFPAASERFAPTSSMRGSPASGRSDTWYWPRTRFERVADDGAGLGARGRARAPCGRPAPSGPGRRARDARRSSTGVRSFASSARFDPIHSSRRDDLDLGHGRGGLEGRVGERHRERLARGRSHRRARRASRSRRPRGAARGAARGPSRRAPVLAASGIG